MPTSLAGGPALWVEGGGTGVPALVMLHGLGANAAVWERLIPVVAARWPGRWLAPDLRGHGRSPHATPYAFGTHAADIAAFLQADEDVVLLGHSMGGAVAMALASGWFGMRVRHVIAFGVKLVWSAEELAKARELARAPVRWFDTREEAIERYLRVSGLKGLVAPASASVGVGIAEEGGRFRLATDPRANGAVGQLPVEALVAALGAPLRLAAGSKDPMVSVADMRRFDREAVVLDGLGHNPHVEAPERLWQLVEETLQPTRRG